MSRFVKILTGFRPPHTQTERERETHTHTLSQSHKHTPDRSIQISLLVRNTHTHSLSLSQCSHRHTILAHTHTLSNPCTHTHTHTHTLTPQRAVDFDLCSIQFTKKLSNLHRLLTLLRVATTCLSSLKYRQYLSGTFCTSLGDNQTNWPLNTLIVG